MPFVNIKITKENGTPTLAQKRELIAGVTNLLAEVLGKNKASTVVIIDEIDTDNYGLGGKTITEVREKSKKVGMVGNAPNLVIASPCVARAKQSTICESTPPPLVILRRLCRRSIQITRI